MENYKINHDLNEYGYSEETAFVGLMPEVMNANGVKTIGGSQKSSKNFGVDGCDALEVIDIEGFYDESTGFTSFDESGTTTGSGNGRIKKEGDIGKKITIDNFTKDEDYPETPDITKGSTRYFDLANENQTQLPSGEGGKSIDISKSDTSYQLYKMVDGNLVATDVWIKIDNE